MPMHCLDLKVIEHVRDLLIMSKPAQAQRELQELIDKVRKEHGYEVQQ